MSPDRGWYRDPYFLHRERYWDNGWTDQVRLTEVEQSDLPAGGDLERAGEEGETLSPAVPAPRQPGAEPPTATYPVAGPTDTRVIAATHVQTPTEATPLVYADGTLVVPTTPPSDDTATLPAQGTDDTLVVATTPPSDDTAAVLAQGTDDTLVVATTPENAGPGEDAPSAYNLLVGPENLVESERPRTYQEGGGKGRSRNWNRRVVFGALALIVAVTLAVVAVVLETGSGGNGHPGNGGAAAPAAGATAATGVSTPTATPTVQAAALRGVAKKAVVVTVALTPTDSTTTASQTASGGGAFVLATGLGPLTISWRGATPEVQKFVFQAAFLYFNVSNSPVPGKSWVVTSTNNPPALGPDAQLGDMLETMGNPGLLLNQLTSTHLLVTSIGSSNVGGVSVQRYEVNLGSSPMESSAAGLGTHISEEVDVGSDHFVRQIVMTGPQVTVNGRAVQENIVVAFSHYGKPTVVTTPPSSEVITFSQYGVRPASSIPGLSGNTGNS